MPLENDETELSILYNFSRRKCTRAPSLVDELLNEIYSRFSSTNGETTSDMSAPYHYGHEFERNETHGKGELQNFYGTSRYIGKHRITSLILVQITSSFLN